jgi:hypothetical protein
MYCVKWQTIVLVGKIANGKFAQGDIAPGVDSSHIFFPGKIKFRRIFTEKHSGKRFKKI